MSTAVSVKPYRLYKLEPVYQLNKSGKPIIKDSKPVAETGEDGQPKFKKTYIHSYPSLRDAAKGVAKRKEDPTTKYLMSNFSTGSTVEVNSGNIEKWLDSKGIEVPKKATKAKSKTKADTKAKKATKTPKAKTVTEQKPKTDKQPKTKEKTKTDRAAKKETLHLPKSKETEPVKTKTEELAKTATKTIIPVKNEETKVEDSTKWDASDDFKKNKVASETKPKVIVKHDPLRLKKMNQALAQVAGRAFKKGDFEKYIEAVEPFADILPLKQIKNYKHACSVLGRKAA